VLADARLYLVTPALEPARLQSLLDGGVDVVQLRMKDAADAAILREAAWMREACAAAGVPFLLNDRPDLAVAARADGVHVGQDDMPVARAREIAGPERLVGLSTHAPAQLAAAPPEADYVAVGPVWATPTKPGRAAAGLAYVSHAAAVAGARPWFAIGGIDRGQRPRGRRGRRPQDRRRPRARRRPRPRRGRRGAEGRARGGSGWDRVAASAARPPAPPGRPPRRPPPVPAPPGPRPRTRPCARASSPLPPASGPRG
jgi:thiamine-phosphate pyrophosphorylase